MCGTRPDRGKLRSRLRARKGSGRVSPDRSMTVDEPLRHIERPSLPWRPETKTGCGLDVAGVPTWTRDEARAKAKSLGRQRFSLFACMTCTTVFGNTPEWDVDPAGCLGRVCDRLGGLRFYRGARHQPERERFAAELRAIAALVEAHRDEFDETVEALLQTTSLDQKRRARQRDL